MQESLGVRDAPESPDMYIKVKEAVQAKVMETFTQPLTQVRPTCSHRIQITPQAQKM